MRDSVSITPTHSLGASSATFLIDQIKFATYFDLDHLLPTSPGRSVLAARALVGLAQGAGEGSPPPGECSLPPDQRFYGGGSASIRGYPYQAVGPNFPNTGYPIGGTALVAGGIEYRQRFGQNFGAAFFVDAGQVSNKLTITPSNIFVGVGAGVRYYTPIGPIRLDVAVPTKLRTAMRRIRVSGLHRARAGVLMARKSLKVAAWVAGSARGAGRCCWSSPCWWPATPMPAGR